MPQDPSLEKGSTLTSDSRGVGDARELEVIGDHYDLEDELGRGGLGRILRARDRRLRRRVAIKIPLKRDGGAQDRFVREALVTARLQHPSIVPIYEAGRWPSGDSYYAMKLVEGQPLAALLDGKRTLEERLALLPNVTAICDAVAYAHAERIVHRDLKPDNVLVGAFGETVVLDWGLAKDLNAGEDERGEGEQLPDGKTVTGAVLGTPRYIAPEQAAGKPIDERADVYSLGAILYHLLAGAPPFANVSPQEALARVLAEPPKPIEGAHPDLIAIVDKAMARRVEDRYPTAKVLAEDLRRFQTGQLVSSRAYSLSSLLLRWVRRHRLVLGVAALSLSALVATGTLSFRRVFAQRNELLLAQARSSLVRDPTEAAAWLKLYPLSGADWPQAISLMAEARALGLARLSIRERNAELAHSEDGTLVAGWSPSDRRFHLYGIDSPRHASIAQADRPEWARFSADGNRVAFFTVGGELRVWDLGRGEARTLVRAPGEKIERFTWSPDGKAMVLFRLSDAAMRLVDVTTGESRILTGHRSIPEDPALSEDGRWLLSGGGDREIRLWDLPAGTGRLVGTHEGVVRTVAISPDGKHGFSGGEDGAIRDWDLATGEMRLLKGHEGLVYDLVVTPDGRSLVSVGGDKLVRIWDLASGTARVLRGHQSPIVDVSMAQRAPVFATADESGTARVWNLDGRRVATLQYSLGRNVDITPDGKRCFLHRQSTLRAWDIGDPEERILTDEGIAKAVFGPTGDWVVATTFGGTLLHCALDGSCKKLQGHRGRVFGIAASPDGKTVATGGNDKTVRIWNLDDGSHRVLTGHEGEIMPLRFSPDGKKLASGGQDNTVRLWDVASGEGRVVARHANLIWALDFSPDGEKIASSAFDGAVRVWDARTGEDRRVGSHDSGGNTWVSFMADGKRLVSVGGDAVVRVWDLESKQARELRGHTDAIWTVVVSPDQRWIASGGVDQIVRVWDVATGEGRALRGHRGIVARIAFGPDSRTLVTGGVDSAIFVWDLATGSSRPLVGHEKGLRAISLSPDGKWALSGAEDGLRLWPLAGAAPLPSTPKEARALLERLTTVELGDDDRARTRFP